MEQTLHILHLEDEPLDSELVEGLLAEDGLTVIIDRVDTMAGFQSALAGASYSLILADYKVPGVDPLEALKSSSQQYSETPFIFFSGTLGEELAVQTLRMGAWDCVSKQSPGRLAPAIRRVLQESEEKRLRRRAEEQLRLQSSALQAAANSILIANRDGVIQWVNYAFEQLTGYSAAEVIGRTPGLLKSGQHPPEFYKRLWETVVAGRVWRSELINRRKDGKLYHEETTITPVRNEQGEITHFVAIKQDITERMQAQEQLKRTNAELRQIKDELEEKVRERTARLQATIAELEAFSYSLSHDMRAPLRAISGYAQTIMEEYPDQIQGEVSTLIDRIVRAGGRMDQMITEVLALARISHMEIRAEVIDVEKLIRQIIEERPELQPPRAEIILQTPMAKVRGDLASLSQCLTNLLDNAVKYVAPGVAPRVHIWTERRKIPNDFASLKPQPLARSPIVRLWVADNGIGIPRTAQAKVFAMFQRLHEPGEYEGTGIGLAIVRKAAERMGGRAGVESEEGKGSRFWLELKNAESEGAGAPFSGD